MRKRINLTLCGFLILSAIVIACIDMAIHPHKLIPMHKFLYVNYRHVFYDQMGSRVSKEALQRAVEQTKQKSWVQEQIASDLAPFKNGLRNAQIDNWYDQFNDPANRLVKYIIAKNKVSYVADTMLPKAPIPHAFEIVHEALSLLAGSGYIPDCQILVAMPDYLAYAPPDVSAPVPIFTFAKDTQVPIEKTTILIPDWMNLRDWDGMRQRIKFASKIYPWKKKLSLIHWRGSTTDPTGDRGMLVDLSSKLPFVDAQFAQGPKFRFMDPEYSLQYKYQVSLDGARATWERMIWQMSANTLLLKPDSSQVQWFHKGLEPYKNYIPIKSIDEKNLAEIHEWLETHEAQTQDIIRSANEFADANFKPEDYLAYYAVLLQEYAKLFKN